MILEVKDGAFSYPGQVRLFSHVDLSLREGEVLAVLGPNGAGKTTLLRCIMGMLSFQVGKCRLDETEISRMPARTLWQRIAYVPQAKGTVASCPAFEMVLLGRSSRIGPFSSPGQEDFQKAEQAMRLLDILPLREKPCCALSGGEYQMVLIARALAAEPEVLILDEPESNLDFKNQLLVLQTIRRLAQSGIGCIFNTHYPAHALQWADTALLLSGGTGLFGEAGRILNEDNLSHAFGVQAVISEVETDQQIFRSVMAAAPGSLPGKKPPDDRPCIAAITIISRAELSTEDLRRILHESRKLITGCAEMPNRREKLSITQLTLEGRRQDIDALSQRLSLLPGLSIKTTFAPPEEADFPDARQEPKLL